MKTIVTTILLVLFGFSIALAQIGIGTSTPDSSAILDLESSNRGFLLPRISTSERNSIPNPATGLIIYNVTISCLEVNDGTPTLPFWNCISSVAGIPDGIILTLYCGNAIDSGILIGSMLATNVYTQIPYIGGNGGIYDSQNVASTGITGLTATLNSGAFASGNGVLTYTITGTPSGAGTANFNLSIGGQNCTISRTVFAVGSYPPGYVQCNPSNPTAVVDILNPATGRTWMDRNLGANRVATSSIDSQSFGSLFQWGRFADGHQCVSRYSGDGVTTSGMINIQASSAIPNGGNSWDGLFIYSHLDWLSPSNNNLWQGLYGRNNPCPVGYRLPTEVELNQERISWVTNDAEGAFNSPLKLPMAGYRPRMGYPVALVNQYGFILCSTVSNNDALSVYFSEDPTQISSDPKADGVSVRCIKN